MNVEPLYVFVAFAVVWLILYIIPRLPKPKPKTKCKIEGHPESKIDWGYTESDIINKETLVLCRACGEVWDVLQNPQKIKYNPMPGRTWV